MPTLTRRAAGERWGAAQAVLRPLLEGAPITGESARQAWDELEAVLRTLLADAGTRGQPLVAAARAAGACSLDEAHLLLEGLAIVERVAPQPDTTVAEDDRARLARAARIVERLAVTDPLAPPPIVPPLAADPAAEAPPRIDLGAPADAPAGRRGGLRWAAVLAAVGMIGVGVYLGADRLLGGRDGGAVGAALRDCRAAFAAGDLARATPACEAAGAAAAAGDRGQAVGLVYLARLRRRAGDAAGAIAAADRAQRLLVDNGLALRELGAAFLDAGTPGEARRAFVAAVQNDAADRAAMAGLACALHRLGRVDEARRWRARAGDPAFDACLAAPPGR